MRILRKTALALSFSVIGVVSSVSALAMVAESESKFHEIEIIADESKDIRIFTNIDDEFSEIELPAGDLADNQKIKAALSELPEYIRDKLVNNLANIHGEGKMVKVKTLSNFIGGVSNDGSESEQVVVFHSNEGNVLKEGVHKVIEGLADGDAEVKVFKFKHGSEQTAESVIHLLNNGEFSIDELDKIQQALDEKR